MEEGDGKLEKKLWKSANKLRGPVESAEYKHIVLGLLFLKYLSDSFKERQEELEGLTLDPNIPEYYTEDEEERQYILEDKDEYYRENVFYIPEDARWKHLVDNAPQPDIGKRIDDAMRIIENENPEFKGMLPKNYERSRVPHDALEELLNLFANIKMSRERKGERKYDQDILGRVYEYFIKEFARKEGHRGGEFYTPKPVVELMVEILEPYEGRIFDPFCGSGGMFVQSYKFLKEHDGEESQISIYGQEINEATWRICEMNLAIRRIDGKIKLGDSLLEDKHKGLKADRVITNPPFNMTEWGKDSIADDDPRFENGLPQRYANYAFIQHMLHHTAKTGVVGTVMANGAMSVQNRDGEIRKEMIEDDLFDVVIALPKELFYTTSIPACIFVLAKEKGKDEYRDRSGETLFVDARDLYKSVDRTLNTLEPEHIQKIADTIRAYRGVEGVEYENEKGFCKVATKEEIADNNYIITPGRYVGIKEEDEEDIPFEVKMKQLTGELREQFQKSNELQEKIERNLEEIGF